VIRLLLDQGIPRRAVPRLQDRGFAARHVADIGLERASDLDILQADRSDRAGLVATVAKSYEGRSGRVGPATTSPLPSASPALGSIAWR
jgi:hypothetical protein